MNSNPDGFRLGFDEVNDPGLERFKRNPHNFLQSRIPGNKWQYINHIMTAGRARNIDDTGEVVPEHLSLLLGIDEERALSGYHKLENGYWSDDTPIIEDASEFKLVKR